MVIVALPSTLQQFTLVNATLVENFGHCPDGGFPGLSLLSGEQWVFIHFIRVVVFFCFVGCSIGFTALLFVFVGFSLEISTCVQKTTFRDEEEGAAEAP